MDITAFEQALVEHHRHALCESGRTERPDWGMCRRTPRTAFQQTYPMRRTCVQTLAYPHRPQQCNDTHPLHAQEVPLEDTMATAVSQPEDTLTYVVQEDWRLAPNDRQS